MSESPQDKFERNVKIPAFLRIGDWLNANRPDLEYLRDVRSAGDVFIQVGERYYVVLIFPDGESFVLLAFWVELTQVDGDGVTFIGEIN